MSFFYRCAVENGFDLIVVPFDAIFDIWVASAPTRTPPRTPAQPTQGYTSGWPSVEVKLNRCNLALLLFFKWKSFTSICLRNTLDHHLFRLKLLTKILLRLQLIYCSHSIPHRPPTPIAIGKD